MKFLVTFELGRLTKWLRVLGYDAVYCSPLKKSEIIIKSLQDDRVILTRNDKIKTIGDSNIVYIKSDFVLKQLQQVISNLKLKIDQENLFSRCLLCNIHLQPIDKSKIKSKIPTYVYKTQPQFRQCPKCNRIYWPGTHIKKVKEYLDKIKV